MLSKSLVSLQSSLIVYTAHQPLTFRKKKQKMQRIQNKRKKAPTPLTEQKNRSKKKKKKKTPLAKIFSFNHFSVNQTNVSMKCISRVWFNYNAACLFMIKKMFATVPELFYFTTVFVCLQFAYRAYSLRSPHVYRSVCAIRSVRAHSSL